MRLITRWCARFELNVRTMIVTSNVVLNSCFSACFMYAGLNSAGKPDLCFC